MRQKRRLAGPRCATIVPNVREDAMARSVSARRSPARWTAIGALLLVAIGGTLWVPIYARPLPKLGDFPFFYWYQLIWVPVVSLSCWGLSALLRTRRDPGTGNDEAASE
jgi:hypothetical protein